MWLGLRVSPGLSGGGIGLNRANSSTMRRTKLSLLVVSFLLIPLVPAGGEPNVRIEREASADWMVPTGKPHHFRWYYAWVWDSQGAGDVPPSFVSIGGGTCVRKRSKNSVSVTCRGSKYAHGKISDFSMAPDASSAHLRFRKNGVTHRVDWTAKEPRPGLYGAEEWCYDRQGNEEGRGLGGGISRDARASGRVFGQRVKKSTLWTEMATGAMASQCSWADRSITDDGRATLTVKLPR